MNSKSILYSFRRCPYAIRARWAILKCGITVFLREVDLKKKAKEFINLSNKGTVPILHSSEGTLIDESLDIIEWAIKNTSNSRWNKETLKLNSKPTNNLIIENDTNFKYHLDRFKYASRYSLENRDFHREEALKIVYYWNKRIQDSIEGGFGGWLMMDSESIADWAIWPFFRQFSKADKYLFEREKELIYIKNWLSYYTSDENFKTVMQKFKKWEPNDSPIIFGM